MSQEEEPPKSYLPNTTAESENQMQTGKTVEPNQEEVLTSHDLPDKTIHLQKANTCNLSTKQRIPLMVNQHFREDQDDCQDMFFI